MQEDGSVMVSLTLIENVEYIAMKREESVNNIVEENESGMSRRQALINRTIRHFNQLSGNRGIGHQYIGNHLTIHIRV